MLRSGGGGGGVSLAGTNTWTAQNTWSFNSAASTPSGTYTGTWFTGGSATTTKPHFLIEPTGTTSTGWSTSGTGLGVNAASGFTGNLIDAQLNGTSKFKVASTGVMALAAGTSAAPNIQATTSASNTGMYVTAASIGFSVAGGSYMHVQDTNTGLALRSSWPLSWSNGAADAGVGNYDLFLYRDAANTLAQRNGTTAQAFHLYETYTDASNYSRVKLSYEGGSFCYMLLTQASGTGTSRSLNLGVGSINAAGQWQINQAAGHFLALADNTYDIGASGATRPRNLYLGNGIYLPEVTAPSAPAANTGVIYCEDSGGKTRLMVRFPSGAAQQIAIEP